MVYSDACDVLEDAAAAYAKASGRHESDELKRLRADEQRFRAALVKIMDCGWSQREAYEIAKAALEGEE